MANTTLLQAIGLNYTNMCTLMKFNPKKDKDLRLDFTKSKNGFKKVTIKSSVEMFLNTLYTIVDTMETPINLKDIYILEDLDNDSDKDFIVVTSDSNWINREKYKNYREIIFDSYVCSYKKDSIFIEYAEKASYRLLKHNDLKPFVHMYKSKTMIEIERYVDNLEKRFKFDLDHSAILNWTNDLKEKIENMENVKKVGFYPEIESLNLRVSYKDEELYRKNNNIKDTDFII